MTRPEPRSGNPAGATPGTAAGARSAPAAGSNPGTNPDSGPGVLLEQLRGSLPAPPAHVVDVGGGTGQLAVRLAAHGHRVTVLDPSAAMLATCAQRAAEHGQATSERLTTVQADAEDAATALGAETADAVICHEVLEHVAAPAVVLTALAGVLRPGGILSLVVANRAWLALRAARRGDHTEAIRLLDDPIVGRAAAIDAPGVATTTRAYTAPELRELLAAAGLTVVTEYGLQVITDPAAAERSRHELERPAQAAALQQLERRMAELEPYRSVAERTHLIAHLDV